MRESSVKLGQLIDDLLALTGVTHSEIRRTKVDSSQMAEQINTRLRKERPKRQVAFVIAPGILVNGDPRLLHIVLDNLLGNAWIYVQASDGEN